MVSLTKDVNRIFESTEDSNTIAIAASQKVFQGSLVGLNSTTGYGRSLVAGDKAMGFAKDNVDNSDGSDGEVNIDVKAQGKISLFISGLTMADIGKSVYATDDNTFTLTETGNSYVGKVIRFEKSDYGIIAFNFFLSEA